MRSYEDKWSWLREQLRDDRAAIETLRKARMDEGKPERAAIYAAQVFGIDRALDYMAAVDIYGGDA